MATSESFRQDDANDRDARELHHLPLSCVFIGRLPPQSQLAIPAVTSSYAPERCRGRSSDSGEIIYIKFISLTGLPMIR